MNTISDKSGRKGMKLKRLRAIAHSTHATAASPLSAPQALHRLIELLTRVTPDYLILFSILPSNWCMRIAEQPPKMRIVSRQPFRPL